MQAFVIHLPQGNGQLVQYGRILLGVFAILRLFFFAKPSWNIVFNNWLLYTEIIHIVVFFIGLLLTFQCVWSVWSFMSGLNMLHRPAASLYSFLLVMGMIASVSNAVMLFISIRKLWTQHFALPIQVLHCVPTFLLIVQTLVQGVYLLSFQNNVHLPQVEARHRQHLQSQQWLNSVLLMYVTTTMIVTANHAERTSLIHVIYATGDGLFRILCIYALKHLVRIKAGNQEQREAENQEEREAGSEEELEDKEKADSFRNSKEESTYNKEKESLIL